MAEVLKIFGLGPLENVGNSVNVSDSVLKQSKQSNITILNPHVQLLGPEAASIAYIRVTQTIDK